MSPVSGSSDDGLHATMAGLGDPYRSLNPLRMKLLRALHDDLPVVEIVKLVEISESTVRSERRDLVLASLVDFQAGAYRPSFLIADRVQTEQVTRHAARLGRHLADYVVLSWGELERHLTAMGSHGDISLADLAFFLVGDKLLDTALLEALATRSQLMPPAPPRPTADDRDARYYFWMIEGRHKQLGAYGQRSSDLPWRSCELLTFGEYRIAGHTNVQRSEMETLTVRRANESSSAEALAIEMEIPIFKSAATEMWDDAMRPHAHALVDVYSGHEQEIRDLHEFVFGSGPSLPDFGEFFCWYDHVAYASAIDVLIGLGLLNTPDNSFFAAIWCTDVGLAAF